MKGKVDKEDAQEKINMCLYACPFPKECINCIDLKYKNKYYNEHKKARLDYQKQIYINKKGLKDYD